MYSPISGNSGDQYVELYNKGTNSVDLTGWKFVDGIDFTFPSGDCVRIEATAKVFARTGVEMEALTAVSVAALTVYDMCKAAERGMAIERVRLEEKAGGASGHFTRDTD